MTVHQASERVTIRSHHGETNVYSYFLASLGAEEKTNCTSMFWSMTQKFSQFYENTGGKDLSYHGHALVMLYVQFLCSNWSKFDRWVHAENLCSILEGVYFDSWSWQSFVSTCDVFNCLFPLDVQNEIQLLSRVFCYSWLVCLLGFWLRNTSLVKIR